jgi:hypothetical protein
MKELIKIKPCPLTQSIAAQVASLPAPTLTRDQAVDVLDNMLTGTDAREVKVLNGRPKLESISEYLSEIPAEAITHVAEISTQAVQGVRWAQICDGRAFVIMQWLSFRYPVLEILRDRIERMRGEARAQKALDKLDVISEEAEQDGAKVKAIELTLRAHHPAFGAKTAQKQASDRPVVVVNIAQIFGEKDEKSPKTVVDAE